MEPGRAMEPGVFYFQVVNRAVAVRLEPNLNAPWSNDRILEVGTVHEASHRVQHADGVATTWFRLADNSGYARQHTHDGEEVLRPIAKPYFTFRVRRRFRINVRAEPQLDCKCTGRVIQAGEEFEECQQKREGEQVFYKLADHSGWAFKLAASGDQVIDAVPNIPRTCRAKVAIGVRRTPDVYSGRTDRVIQEGENFAISRRIAADDRVQVFYELADGSGWVFKVLPEGGRECVEELNPPGGDGSLCRIM